MRAIPGAALALAVLWAGGAQAGPTCGTLRILASLPLVAADHGNAMVVPVRIDGQAEALLLDTGGLTSQLSRAAVERLNLTPRTGHLNLLDVGGHASDEWVRADSVQLGNLMASGAIFVIAPNPDLGGLDGILSTDLMSRYDIDMDFAALRLNYFSPDHCPGQVVYWHAPAVAVVPMRMQDHHIMVPVSIDGQAFDAVLDTGATRSTIGLSMARSVFGLKPGGPGMTPAGPVNGDPSLVAYYHVFSSLTFPGITVRKPGMMILPDVMGTKDGETHIRDMAFRPPSLGPILGMDVLKHLHVYIAYGEQKLYITAANPADQAALEPARSRPAPPAR